MKQRLRSNSITRKLYNIIITTALITMIIVSLPVILIFSAIIKDNAIADKKNHIPIGWINNPYQAGKMTRQRIHDARAHLR